MCDRWSIRSLVRCAYYLQLASAKHSDHLQLRAASEISVCNPNSRILFFIIMLVIVQGSLLRKASDVNYQKVILNGKVNLYRREMLSLASGHESLEVECDLETLVYETGILRR
jgi:hypothetical protein